MSSDPHSGGEPGPGRPVGEDGAGNAGEEDRSQSLAGRLVAGGTKSAQRVAGATGVDRAVEAAVEDAIVRAIESEATERAIGRILNGPVVEQAARDAIQSDAVERALVEAIDSEMVDRVWARLLDSDETQRLIERIAEAPEVRAAIASQGIGLIDDVGRQVARVTRILDFIGERIARRILFLAQRSTPTDRVGLFTRAAAIVIDFLLVNAALVTTAAVLGLMASAFGVDLSNVSSALVALGALTWIVIGSLYLLTFWALSGQTPGMRFLDIRIEREGVAGIGAGPAVRRLIGFWLAVIPFCLGFVGVLVRIDRRGFHDRLGRTAVYYVNPAEPDQPHEAAAVDARDVAPVGTVEIPSPQRQRW